MSCRRQRTLLFATFLVAIPSIALAQTTTLNASALTMRSTGSISGSDVTLSSNGFLGTYVTLAAPGSVTLNLTASGVSSPHVNLVVDDAKLGIDVASGFSSYSRSVNLPAGTHFIRAEYTNDTPTVAARTVTMRSLQVSGATVSNADTNANALAASDSYIANFRRGSATVELTGPGEIPLLGGQSVAVDLKRNAFNFGTAVPGTSTTGVNNYFGSSSTTLQTNYQSRLNQNFNTIVPENAGKWAYNEATRNTVTMTAVDQMLTYAQAHDLRTRMHNLIWGDNSNNGQQPSWVLNDSAAPNNGLLDKAYLGDATAKTDLRTEISQRIAYYVGTGAATDRAKKYAELDVYNESYHTGVAAPSSPTDLRHNYWNIYGAAGVADIYREVKQAVAASGATTKLYVNEYSALGDGNYANFYTQHIEDIRNAGIAAGYGDVVDGIGLQYYPSNLAAHSASRFMEVLQNVDVQGLPTTLTEFGVMTGASSSDATTILGESLRLMYGNPQATGFLMWGFHQESGTGATTLFAPAAALYTVNTSNFAAWTLTDAGKKWQDLLGIADWDGDPTNGWSTHVTPTINADGTVTFNGYYGDYDIGGQHFALNLAKGTTNYSVTLAAPPDWYFWKTTNAGSWNAGANWTSGLANGIGTTAHFGSSAAPRGVSVDSAITVGQINFDSASSYTLGGAGLITLDVNGANDARVNVLHGAHTISANVQANDPLTLRVDAGAALSFTGDLTPASAGLTLVKNGAGAATLKKSTFDAVLIAGGTLRTTAGTSVCASLNVSSGATLDITGTSWIVDYSGTSPLSAIRDRILAARGSGLWDGEGITSSNLIGAPTIGIGFAEASAIGVTNFGGISFTGDAVLFRATLLGDTNLDGVVNFDDLLRLAQNYNAGTDKTWTDGDTNYDGVVNFDDVLTLAQTYGQTVTGSFAGDWLLAQSMAPEPGSLFVLSSLGFVLRRRRSPLLRVSSGSTVY